MSPSLVRQCQALSYQAYLKRNSDLSLCFSLFTHQFFSRAFCIQLGLLIEDMRLISKTRVSDPPKQWFCMLNLLVRHLSSWGSNLKKRVSQKLMIIETLMCYLSSFSIFHTEALSYSAYSYSKEALVGQQAVGASIVTTVEHEGYKMHYQMKDGWE